MSDEYPLLLQSACNSPRSLATIISVCAVQVGRMWSRFNCLDDLLMLCDIRMGKLNSARAHPLQYCSWGAKLECGEFFLQSVGIWIAWPVRESQLHYFSDGFHAVRPCLDSGRWGIFNKLQNREEISTTAVILVSNGFERTCVFKSV